MQLPNADITTVRTQPQSSELYLSVFQPTTVLTATPSGTVSKGSMEIPYVTTSGSYLSVEAGMTLLVGTSSGGRELGKIRIRSITANRIVVAENSHIDWASATHLTVIRFWELFPVYPRIIQDPGNDENVIFYKDYDIEYTDQNETFGTFACAGPHRAGLVGDSLYWSSSGTYNLLEQALTYEWAFEGGTPTGSTSAYPGNVQYNSPGHYVTRLKVTAANGTVDTTYRYVSIYNGAPTIKNWNVTSISGSREEGGYSTSISIVNEEVTVHDGDVVVIWANDWYGSENRSIGGNAHGNQRILFTGHVLDGSIRYNYQSGMTSFSVGSVTDLMKAAEGFSISVESKASPSTWFELYDMDGRRALYHYLKWHTTLLSISDFRWSGQDQKIQYFDSDRESLFDAVDNYMRGTLLGSVCADRQGAVWAEVGAWAVSNPTGTFPSLFSIQKQDWINEPSIDQRYKPALSYLELGGIAYSGVVTGTFDAFIAASPGQTPNVRGSVERHQGLALAGQTHLNAICGNLYANRNAKNYNIAMDLAGNYRNFDIAPQEATQVNILAADANIDTDIIAPFLVNSVTWSYDSSKKTLRNSIGLIPLLNGTSADTVSIPDVPDTEGYGDAGDFGGLNFALGKFPPFFSEYFSAPMISGWGDLPGGTSTPTTIPLPPSNVLINNGWTFSYDTPPPGIYLVTYTFYVDPGGDDLRVRMPGQPFALTDFSYLMCDPDKYISFTSLTTGQPAGSLSQGLLARYSMLVNATGSYWLSIVKLA